MTFWRRYQGFESTQRRPRGRIESRHVARRALRCEPLEHRIVLSGTAISETLQITESLTLVEEGGMLDVSVAIVDANTDNGIFSADLFFDSVDDLDLAIVRLSGQSHPKLLSSIDKILVITSPIGGRSPEGGTIEIAQPFQASEPVQVFAGELRLSNSVQQALHDRPTPSVPPASDISGTLGRALSLEVAVHKASIEKHGPTTASSSNLSDSSEVFATEKLLPDLQATVKTVSSEQQAKEPSQHAWTNKEKTQRTAQPTPTVSVDDDLRNELRLRATDTVLTSIARLSTDADQINRQIPVEPTQSDAAASVVFAEWEDDPSLAAARRLSEDRGREAEGWPVLLLIAAGSEPAKRKQRRAAPTLAEAPPPVPETVTGQVILAISAIFGGDRKACVTSSRDTGLSYWGARSVFFSHNCAT